MRKIWIPGLLLLICFSAVPAGAAGLREVVATLETPFSSETREGAIHDFTAEFFQESRLISLDRMQRGRGDVSVRFDHSISGKVPKVQFHWEYLQPTNQEIVSDGRTMWVYLPENRQVIQSNIEQTMQARENDPMTFLTGLGNLSRDFTIGWANPNHDVEGNYLLRLTPIRVSNLIREMQIVVSRDAVDDYTRNGRTGGIFPMLSTSVTDPQGNRTIIEFRDIRVNRGTMPTQFSFIIPAGVEVVRPTGSEMGY